MANMSKAQRQEIEALARKAEEAANKYIKCSLNWKWAGTSRSVRGELKDVVATHLGSKKKGTKASTELYNWKNAPLKAIRSFKRHVKDAWEDMTAEWVEDATRLLPKRKINEFEAQMSEYKDVLNFLAQKVQENREEIIREAKELRGKAFNPKDYPADLATEFAVTWSYAPLTVSKELRDLSESAYSAEQARQAMRITGAVQLAERAKTEYLRDMVINLIDKLGPRVEGEQKRLRDPALDHLKEFCQNFSEVICWGSDDIEEIVMEASVAVAGLEAEEIRKNADLKESVRKKLEAVAARLDEMCPEESNPNEVQAA